MVELSRNARVAVRNPSRVVGYSAPRSIEGRILARGPAGPSGGPIPVGGTAGQVVTPDGFGDYVWTTVGAILGLSGNAVGTSDVQVLTNKDLSSATNTFPSSLATDAELSAHSDATAAHGATGAVVGTTDTQTLTNKTLGATNTINGFTASRFMQSDGTGKLAASSKTLPSGTVVGTTDTQTLTNKDLSSSTNAFPATLERVVGSWTLVATRTGSDAIVSSGTATEMRYTATVLNDTSVFVHDGTMGGTARFTAQVACTVRVMARHTFGSSSTGMRVLKIVKGASDPIGYDSRPGNGSDGTPLLGISPAITFAAGDYFTVQVTQNSGSSLNIFSGADGYNFVTIDRLA